MLRPLPVVVMFLLLLLLPGCSTPPEVQSGLMDMAVLFDDVSSNFRLMVQESKAPTPEAEAYKEKLLAKINANRSSYRSYNVLVARYLALPGLESDAGALEPLARKYLDFLKE